MTRTPKQLIGDWGEKEAQKFLKKSGYSIVDRNYRTRRGEIDIIAKDVKLAEPALCFIEVKTRQREDGSATGAVNYKKLRAMQYAAKLYCVSKNIEISNTAIRFEHVAVYYKESPDQVRICHRVIEI